MQTISSPPTDNSQNIRVPSPSPPELNISHDAVPNTSEDNSGDDARHYSDHAILESDTVNPATLSVIEDVKLAQQLVFLLEHANIKNGDLSEESLAALQNPIQSPLVLDDYEDHILLYCLRLYLGMAKSGTGEAYKVAIEAAKLNPQFPDREELFSLSRIERQLELLSGIHAIQHDMCPQSCLAYTGLFSDDNHCSRCQESRYHPGTKEARQKFQTIPIGPTVQTLYRHPEHAQKMRYFRDRASQLMEEYNKNGHISIIDDIVCGTEILEAVKTKCILPTDTLLIATLDGAQLYEKKQSDCWMLFWIVVNLAPDLRYKVKSIYPGFFIPGPNKPKVVDSFLFPSLHHVAAVNRMNDGQGLLVWDAALAALEREALYYSRLFIIFGTADRPGMVYFNGMVGHSGKNSCQALCPVPGRHKLGAPHYYPALFKPDDYDVAGCTHPDIDPEDVPFQQMNQTQYDDALAQVVASRNPTAYERNRKETGICKPSIFSGLGKYTLGVPNMFPCNIMHLILNLADLLLSLYRGTLECDKDDDRSTWYWAVLKGSKWKVHGAAVARCRQYLPGSFDRPPRNPAEKINSGYKCWEFLLYIFGYGPGLFYGLLPTNIWKHFCKLVHGFRIIYQHKATVNDLTRALFYLTEFASEFEKIFVLRMKERIHFVRQSIHTLYHLVPEYQRKGPLCTVSQWACERAIGSHVGEIKQHSQVYSHISEIGVRRARINSLKTMLPKLDDRDKDNEIPRGGVDLGGNFVLLRKLSESRTFLEGSEREALRSFYVREGTSISEGWTASVFKWARLRLPNGQIVRSTWWECSRKLKEGEGRNSRNVKVRDL
jgi:hypothetical protein